MIMTIMDYHNPYFFGVNSNIVIHYLLVGIVDFNIFIESQASDCHS
jgi:hypothetical protein